MEKDTSEIAKLAERIAKDPKSKLFVPLAEEHKKAGDIEMAVQVLTEGLKNNPSYVTARSFLGRLLMDQGDLAGARKELEEVIKAIPDNLLAQRKLGDIYVLQGSPADAVQRYKAALALNPGDKELPSLIADISGGKDVSARIPKPKTTASPAAAKPEPAVAAAVQPKAPAAAAKPAAPSAPAAAAKAPSPQPQPKPAPAPTAPSSSPDAPVVAKSATSATPAAPAAAPARPQPSPTPSAASPVPAIDEAEVIEDLVDIEPIGQPEAAPAAETPVRGEKAPPMPEAMSFDLSESPVSSAEVAEEPMATVWVADETDAAVAKPAPAADASGDDLNTNTLAELYISQGFYDKSLEIYQGMLNDKPGNKALQQKIGQLKELAGAEEASAALRATPVNAGAREYTPPPAETETKAAMPAPAQKAPPASPPMEPSAGTPVARSTQTASVRRKETIDRLESWLKNVSKEKP